MKGLRRVISALIVFVMAGALAGPAVAGDGFTFDFKGTSVPGYDVSLEPGQSYNLTYRATLEVVQAAQPWAGGSSLVVNVQWKKWKGSDDTSWGPEPNPKTLPNQFTIPYLSYQNPVPGTKYTSCSPPVVVKHADFPSPGGWFSDAWVANSSIGGPLRGIWDVRVLKAASGWQSAGGAKQALPPKGPLLPKPSLSIVAAKPPKIDPACQNITQLLTAAVGVRNSGSPLAQGKGTVFVKEFGGASLGSGGIALPALGPNETKVVEIPVGTLASFAPGLPGQHKLTVGLNPAMDPAGQLSFVPPASPYEFQVMFPPGYCQAKLDKGQPANKAQPVPPAGAPAPPGRPIVPRQ